jgi:15-cis-phytoene synthase
MKNKPERKSSFLPAFFFLSEDKKEALSAVYAFCRLVDDIVDEPTHSNPKEELNFWHMELDNLYEGNPTHDISKRLLRSVRKFDLKKEHFNLVLEGVEEDLHKNRYKTFEELEFYIYRVASAVGLLSIKIFGYESPKAEEFAKNLGYAVQLTNIIRDMAKDGEKNRIYLPLEDLQRFGCREEDVLKANPCINALLDFEIERTQSFYRVADKNFAFLTRKEKKNMLPAQIMGCIYFKILGKIRNTKTQNILKRQKLSGFEKLGCILNAWRKTW